MSKRSFRHGWCGDRNMRPGKPAPGGGVQTHPAGFSVTTARLTPGINNPWRLNARTPPHSSSGIPYPAVRPGSPAWQMMGWVRGQDLCGIEDCLPIYRVSPETSFPWGGRVSGDWAGGRARGRGRISTGCSHQAVEMLFPGSASMGYRPAGVGGGTSPSPVSCLSR